MMTLLWILAQDAFWSAIAAMGFAMLFNVPRRALPYCMIAGAVGHTVRTLMMQQFGVGVELAAFSGAALVGVWAKLVAQRLKMPSMIFAICGAIPLVPGVYAYRTMIGILQIASIPAEEAPALLVAASVNAIKTGLILAAIAVGIVMPTLLFQREKPVV